MSLRDGTSRDITRDICFHDKNNFFLIFIPILLRFIFLEVSIIKISKFQNF